MQKGTLVKVVNPDSSFCGKVGTVRSSASLGITESTKVVRVFLREKKKSYSFLSHDLEVIKK